MKRYLLLLIIVLSLTVIVKAQTGVKKRHLDENTVVKDTSGTMFAYPVWQAMVKSGDYVVKPLDPSNDSTAFVIYKLSEEQKDKRLSRMKKPAESEFFTTGEKIASFRANDLDGFRIKLKELEGKVVVLNFWFIGCPPCRREIPELNKLALSYANDPNVVFIAIALDNKSEIKEFIKNTPFAYHIVDDGRMYANLYKIHLFPTNVVLDKEGKVRFHASGYTLNTPYWIKKTIEESR